MMITWLMLASLFCESIQDENGQENGVLHCGPQNLSLSTCDQMIMSTWEDDLSCFEVHSKLIYELMVLIADKQAHYEQFVVMPDQIGSIHSWNWTSHLALECAPHSVRLRSRHSNRTSPWKEQTFHGKQNLKDPEIFPQDKIYKVGSRVVFCCILPAGEIFYKMYLTGYNDSNMHINKISNQTFTLSVHLNQASSSSGIDVICETSKPDTGASIYIGYPPRDSDLQCETQNLQSLECHWTVGNTHLSHKSPTVYHLLGSQRCVSGSLGRCKMEVQLEAGKRNWTLTAQNALGKVELSDSADLTKRVHMIVPKGLKTSIVHARNVTLNWRWTVQQYNNLNISCQVKVSHGETHTINKNFGVGLRFAVLFNLMPNCTYNVTVQCGTAQNFWKWSDWSTSLTFQTKSDVPDAPDVWMQVKNDKVIIIWKTRLANQSHERSEDYEVTWVKTTEKEQENRTKVGKSLHSLAMRLDATTEYIVTVTARNINGSSPPSAIIIPSHSSESSSREERVNTSRIIGSRGGFNLSWSASPLASCGYVVDWCPILGDYNVEWLKVPTNETNVTIFPKNFIKGVRYLISIYACTQGAPVILERREGYASEKEIEDGTFKSMRWNQQGSDVEVSWDPINPREQPAFIQGYVLYCLSINNNIIINVSTDNPEATNLTVRKLNLTSYTFTMKARTAIGECGTTSISATLNSLSDNLDKPVFIPVVIVFSLLSIIIIICYRHRICIKQKIYPPIPKPVLTDKWLTSPSSHLLCMAQCHHSEADIVDVSVLHCNSVAVHKDSVSQENMLFVFSQTPKGYYNQPLKMFTPPHLTLPSTTLPSQAGLPSSPFRSVYTNLSYNLIVETGDQQSILGPELQEVPLFERSSSGYQPHVVTQKSQM